VRVRDYPITLDKLINGLPEAGMDSAQGSTGARR